MSFFRTMLVTATTLGLSACAEPKSLITDENSQENCPIELVVLGVGQDAGAPQIGNPNDPAWKDPSERLYATSLGLLDHDNGKRYLFEATPDIREQMQIMDTLLPYDGEGPYIDGIFLTHAHIGHYAGLMFLGRESMGAKGVPVYAMPRMQDYLEHNGPWSQLVELGNIELLPNYLETAVWFEEDDHEVSFHEPGNYAGSSFERGNPNIANLSDTLKVRARIVEHRDEFSETVAYMIYGLDKSLFFVPDIDSWSGKRGLHRSEIRMWASFPFFLKDFVTLFWMQLFMMTMNCRVEICLKFHIQECWNLWT